VIKYKKIQYRWIIGILVAIMMIYSQVIFSETYKPTGQFEGKQVLIINSYHPTLKWSEDLSRSVIENKKKSATDDVKFYLEFMDWKEYPTEEMIHNFEELMIYKYADRKLDLVIALDDAALSFALEYQDMIYKDTPIVFAGVSELSYHEMVQDRKNLTGIFETVEIKDTIEIAQMVSPGIKKLFIVYDQTESGKSMGQTIALEVKEHYPEIQTIAVTDRSIQEIEAYVSQIDPQDGIIMTAYFEDTLGQTIDFEDMTDKVSAAGEAPVFSIYDFCIGHGAIGGDMLSPTIMGTHAGTLAVRILSGEQADQIPIMQTRTHIKAVDYYEAKAFGIDFSKLPKEIQILNKPISLFEQYRGVVIVSLMIMFVLFILTVTISFYLKKTLALKKGARQGEF